MRDRQKKHQEVVHNQKVRDNGAKLIFDDPILCAQFLRGYTNVPLLQNVQPEDIEDISERFLPMWQEGRDSDSVKKVHLKETSLFLITIVEHQSQVHFDMAFRILRYIVMVLTDYQEEQGGCIRELREQKIFNIRRFFPLSIMKAQQSGRQCRISGNGLL